MGDAERRERIQYSTDDGLRRGNRSGLARTFDPERVGRGRDAGQSDVQVGQVDRAWHLVVHERSAEHLADSGS